MFHQLTVFLLLKCLCWVSYRLIVAVLDVLVVVIEYCSNVTWLDIFLLLQLGYRRCWRLYIYRHRRTTKVL
ncbi:hypothetical protein BDV32DRAFT_121023, partial [Aspergillus pseudonomiae]